jgi:hypothetical protein
LRKLLVEVNPRANQFRKDIRKYNGTLAFTSISYNRDDRLTGQGGIQCFQIHGELFHFQGPLRPEDGTNPSFAQLFFYDPEFATDLRMDKYPNLDRFILRELLQELTDCNPFIDLYKTARERLRECPASEYQIVLNPQMRLVMQTGADRRRENLLTSNKVAVILLDEFEEALRRDIILARRNFRGGLRAARPGRTRKRVGW